MEMDPPLLVPMFTSYALFLICGAMIAKYLLERDGRRAICCTLAALTLLWWPSVIVAITGRKDTATEIIMWFGIWMLICLFIRGLKFADKLTLSKSHYSPDLENTLAKIKIVLKSNKALTGWKVAIDRAEANIMIKSAHVTVRLDGEGNENMWVNFYFSKNTTKEEREAIINRVANLTAILSNLDNEIKRHVSEKLDMPVRNMDGLKSEVVFK